MGLKGLWLKLRALLAPERAQREIDDELRFHVDMEAEANVRRGMDAVRARREAFRRFGGMERFREQTREARGTAWLEDAARDARFGLRSLARSPGFASAALLTITLGVGATTAVFSVVRGVLLEPLPFPEPDELVTVWLANPGQGIDEDITSWPNFHDWRSQAGSFEFMVAVRPGRWTLTGDGEPDEVRGAAVTEGFFEMLGTPLAMGSGFGDEGHEDAPGRVVVLSHELWSSRWGADPAILGRAVLINGQSHRVVGVTRPGVRYPSEVELWAPLVFGESLQELREARGALWLPVVGRLATGVSLSEAQAEVSSIARRLEVEYPRANGGMGITLEPLHETLVGDVRTPLMMLLGAVALVLLVGAANVANLLLARGAARMREMAVRLSLGAGRARVFRQVVTESALLGLLGGAAGTVVAWLAVGGLVSAAPADLPRLDEVGLDLPLLAFALVVSLATGLVFGLLPALQVARTDPAGRLREGARGGEGNLSRLRPLFVVGQFALALVLLVGAGLLVRSFTKLRAVDPGFRTEGVLVAEVILPASRYPSEDAVRGFVDELTPVTQAIPGIASTGVISTLLLDRLPNMGTVSIESRPQLPEEDQRHPVVSDGVTPGLTETLGMEIVAGRTISPSDVGEPRVAVVNEAFVRRFLPVGDPIGERFMFGTPQGDDPPWNTVVGVARDARRSGLDQPVRPSAFLPYAQLARSSLDVVVRTDGDPAAFAGAVREAIRRVDPDLPVRRLRTLDQAMAESLARRRFVMTLLGAFAGIGTVLAAVGIYGVMAYLVGRRTREIGIRIALGAERRQIVFSVLREGLLQASAGVALGLAAALLMGGLVRSQLFGLEPSDPTTFLAVAAVLVGVAMGASWVPAWRAARVDPVVTLNTE